MAKRMIQLTETQFRVMIGVIILAIVGIVYFAAIEDRFRVTEFYEGYFTGSSLIPKGEVLRYETEFCANKLSHLAHEAHFLESDIVEQEKLITEDSTVFEEEINLIEKEKQELDELKENFYESKQKCDKFDNNLNIELCEEFLNEAKHSLEIAQESVDSAKGFLEKTEISTTNLKKAERIYKNLNVKCQNLQE